MSNLKRVLGLKSITLITINSIAGSGLFFIPSIAAYHSGPSSIIAWIILSLIAIYMSMCLGELISMFPSAGGIYEFTKQAYGRFTSFFIGWFAWLIGNVITAMLIVIAVQYLLPFSGNSMLIMKFVISVFWVIIFNAMAYRGMKTSSFMLTTFSLITLFLMIILIIAGYSNINPGNYEPFFIYSSIWDNFSHIFISIFFISVTFFGLESVTFLSEETKNPSKTLPKALVYATIIIAIMSTILVITSLGAVNYKLLGISNAPFTLLASIAFGSVGFDLINLGIYLIIMGSAAVWVVTGPRLLLALTRDKLFIPKFNAIHKEFGTPHRSIIFQCVMTLIFIVVAFLGNGFKTLLSILIPMVLIIMSFTILSLTILRIKKPQLIRHYKAPFGIVGPIIITLFLISLIILWIIYEQNAVSLLILIGSFILIALPIYFLLELYYSPKTIEKTNDAIAYFSYLLEDIIIPKKMRAKILNYLGDIKGKKVMDFGCSVGTMTVPLTKEVGNIGFVYGIESSIKDINIVKKRLLNKNRENYIIFRDQEEYSRIHPYIQKVDAVVSVGLISYVQNLQNILKELNKKLKINGIAVFADYDKMFDVIPNIDWLEDDDLIKKYFKSAGFDVKIEREQGMAWGYVYLIAQKKKEIK